MDDAVQAVARALGRAEQVVVATGAGMSRESGIPTFREAQTGLWARYDPESLATEAAFRSNPERVFAWYAWRRSLVAGAALHPGYSALVEMEALVSALTIITQNTDGLHRRAGSQRVIELHGALDRFCCVESRHPYPSERVPLGNGDAGALTPPRCDGCGALVRPDIVWFGEPLPQGAQSKAWEHAAACDVMLVVGTSGLVYPAAYLPSIAHHAGATVVEINPSQTELTPVAHLVCRGTAGTVLPRLVEALQSL